MEHVMFICLYINALANNIILQLYFEA